MKTIVTLNTRHSLVIMNIENGMFSKEILLILYTLEVVQYHSASNIRPRKTCDPDLIMGMGLSASSDTDNNAIKCSLKDVCLGLWSQVVANTNLP